MNLVAVGICPSRTGLGNLPLLPRLRLGRRHIIYHFKNILPQLLYISVHYFINKSVHTHKIGSGMKWVIDGEECTTQQDYLDG